MINLSRIKIMKGMAYSVALVAIGAGGLTLAKVDSVAKVPIYSDLPTCDITIYQLQNGAREVVSLMNLTGQTVTLDEITPVKTIALDNFEV